MKFVFEFDTVTKKATATMDGAPVADLARVEAYRCGPGENPDFCLKVLQVAHNEESGVTEERCVYASADDRPARRAKIIAQAFAKACAEAKAGERA